MYYLTKIYSIACKVKKKNLDYKILAPLFVHKCDRRGHGAVACRLLSYIKLASLYVGDVKTSS